MCELRGFFCSIQLCSTGNHVRYLYKTLPVEIHNDFISPHDPVTSNTHAYRYGGHIFLFRHRVNATPDPKSFLFGRFQTLPVSRETAGQHIKLRHYLCFIHEIRFLFIPCRCNTIWRLAFH